MTMGPDNASDNVCDISMGVNFTCETVSDIHVNTIVNMFIGIGTGGWGVGSGGGPPTIKLGWGGGGDIFPPNFLKF